MTAVEWCLLLTLSVLWGGSFFFAEVALSQLPPMTIVASRVAGAALTLHLALVAIGRPLRLPMRTWADFAVMGLLNNAIPFSLIVWGQVHIASGLAAILNATTPLFALIVAHALTADEKLTGARLAGVAVGFTGVVAMVGGSALETLGTQVWAQVAVLGAALSYAFAGVWGRRFKHLPPTASAAGQLTASSALIVPVALALDSPWTLPLPGAWTVASVGALAVLSTALAYVIVFRILRTAGAVNVLLVTFLIPVSAVTLGALVLGEVLSGEQIAGMALIGAGLACVDGRPLRVIRRLRHRTA